MTTRPKVSIGLPVYNGEDFLEQAIASILHQDFRDLELIISDNGSTDGTEDICKRFAGSDSRVRYLRSESNRGAAWNYNRVFELSRGQYFKWQAHDDLCLPEFISRCVREFESAKSTVVLVYPRTEVIDANGKHLREFRTESIDSDDATPHRRLAKVLRNLNMACAVFGLVRSSALRKSRLIGSFIASDYVLLSELALLGELREVPEVLFQRRVHARISTYASRSNRELRQWFDPTGSSYKDFISPMLWLGVEYIQSIRRLPLRRIDRVRCYATTIAVWYTREFRNMGGRYKARIFGSWARAKS